MNQNVRKRREIEDYLATIQFLSEGTNDTFFVWDIKTGQIYFSEDVYEKYPLPFHGGEGNTLQECEAIVFERDREQFMSQMKLIADGKEESVNMQFRLVEKEGNKQWVTCRGKSRMDGQYDPVWMLGRISSGELRQKVDLLTGLFNVDKFMEDMQMCHDRGASGYLMILGIDNLKNINIKYGREYGNYVLKKVTENLEEVITSAGNIYRLDGDCFAIMLPNAEQEKVAELYGVIRKNVADYCTVSAGSAFCSPSCNEDCSLIYQYAEDALDRAKKEGKNMLRFFSRDSYEKRLNTLRLQEELAQSVQDGCEGFYLCYQPFINNHDFSLWGCEALLRYASPSRGKMSPVEFIPLLEDTELICPVGEWVLQRALEQCREWRKWMPNFHVNVNVSYVQLRKEGICERVLELLRRSGLPGSALSLEVTESMQLEDYQYFNDIFFRWKMAGINIAIDDFGTGYSSLGYLKSIVADEVKIDRCFVTDIQRGSYDYKLLGNVIELAHSAEIKVCCEGVEKEEELMVLQELEPDVIQGYLFGKPCEKEEFETQYVR